MFKIYNTLSKSIEEFKPINPPNVGIYTCGPTVYDFMHVGNLRTFILSDIIARTLSHNGYKVKSVQNITDIDDKIIQRATERKISVEKLSSEFTKYFLLDVEKLNILPKADMPVATKYISKMQDFIKKLIAKDFAYVEKDGSVYFDISKFKDYGKLSGIKKENLKTGTRTLSDDYAKENVEDFALWKSVGDNEVGFDSPWGKGRPGWHIECSVMSEESLGQPFDIHIGGTDLIFPHHENEIAQSEAKNGRNLANYFVHGAHLLVDGKKMSKSLNNFYTLKDVEKKGFDPLALRYLYFETHYRQEMNFTWGALEAGQNALNRLRNEFVSWEEAKIGCAEFEKNFMDAVNDDLNMPKALSVAWEMVKSDYPNSAKKKSLLKMDEILGLGLAAYKEKPVKLPPEVQRLIDEQIKLRTEGNYVASDIVRDQINSAGYVIENTKDGTIVKKK